MSGPKYGEARIDLPKLNELFDELKDMLEEAKCDKINNQITEILKETEVLKNEYKNEKYEELIKKAAAVIPYSENLKNLEGHIVLFAQLVNTVFPAAERSPELLINKLLYDERLHKIKNLMEIIKAASQNLKQEYDEICSRTDEENFRLRDWKNKKEKKIAIISPKVTEVYNKILDELMAEKNFSEIKSSLDAIIANDALDDYYKINQMQLRLDAVEIEKSSQYNFIEYQNFAAEFAILSESLGRTGDLPKDLSELKEAVLKLEEELRQSTVSNYISNSLGSVMTELGYSIISSEAVNKSAQSIEKIYYDFSDVSVLNTATSDDGAVLFEVMGKNKELSDSQKQLIKQDMDKFCPDYYKIKEKLKNYGITLEKEYLCEPNVKYARGADVVSMPEQSERRCQKQARRMRLDG